MLQRLVKFHAFGHASGSSSVHLFGLHLMCLFVYAAICPCIHLSIYRSFHPFASNLVMPSQPDLPRTNPKLFCPPNNKRRHGPATAKVTPSEKTNATSLRKWIVPSMPQGQVSTLAELRTRSEKTHALIGIGIHLPLPKVVKFISGYFFDILTSK